MGGNALKNCDTVRLNKKDYTLLTSTLVTVLQEKYNTDLIKLIPSYHSKETFGDADILITSSKKAKINSDLRKSNSKEIVSNGDVISFEFNNFQIDYIFKCPLIYDMCYNYYSWNDCGNLIGKIAKRMGFKYGHDGLHYVLREGTEVIEDIHVSIDFESILKFLGFKQFKIEQYDFNTLNDIFYFIIGNPYFSYKTYLLENIDNKSRVRDRKRETYQQFLNYLKTHDIKKHFEITKDTKEEFLKQAFKEFDGFEDQYNLARSEWNIKQLSRKKINGDIVQELTGLEGKELGDFITQLRIVNRDLHELCFVNKKGVENFILEYYKEWKSNERTFTWY